MHQPFPAKLAGWKSSWPLLRPGLQSAGLDSQAAPLRLLANKWVLRGPQAIQVAAPRRGVEEWRRSLRRIGDKRAAMPHGGRGRCVLRARRVRAVDLCWAWRPYRQARSPVNADWLPRLRLLPTDRSDRDRAFCARGATNVA